MPISSIATTYSTIIPLANTALLGSTHEVFNLISLAVIHILSTISYYEHIYIYGSLSPISAHTMLDFFVSSERPSSYLLD